jgi:hypothetical protein
MLVAAAVLPHPPLLLPEISRSEPDWLAELRGGVAASMRSLLAHAPDVVVAVAAAEVAAEWDESAGGSLAGFGVDVRAGAAELVLPAPLTIAAWLLDDAGWAGRRRYATLAHDADPERCAVTGRALADAADRVAMVAMGDGSAKRTDASPGTVDERAAAFDREAADAIAAADRARLLAVDPALGAELWAAGVAPWQALAGAIDDDRPIATRVRYDAAPRGVGYFVVDWSVSDASR